MTTTIAQNESFRDRQGIGQGNTAAASSARWAHSCAPTIVRYAVDPIMIAIL
jgi:hypothetical protein